MGGAQEVHETAVAALGEESPTADDARGDNHCTGAELKIIFLDMDGPLAPYANNRHHRFSYSEQLDQPPYAPHAEALLKIINACGGPGVVKVVLSSNWRTMHERVLWLEREFARLGIQMLGHTDVVEVWPALPDQCSSATRRNLELLRVLKTGVIGEGGAIRDSASQKLQFVPAALPADTPVTSWIAIDDMALDEVPRGTCSQISAIGAFMAAAGDVSHPNGAEWLAVSDELRLDMERHHAELRRHHFVQVDCVRGLAGTHGAVDKAIHLLGTGNARSLRARGMARLRHRSSPASPSMGKRERPRTMSRIPAMLQDIVGRLHHHAALKAC